MSVLNLAIFHVVFRIERGTFLGGDSSEYLHIAQMIRSEAFWGSAQNGKPLGFPLVLAVVSSLPGDLVTYVLVFNALCVLWTVHVVGLIMRLLRCSRGVSLAAQVVFALVPNTAAWANLVYSDTMAMALFVTNLWVLLHIMEGGASTTRCEWFALLGVLLGWLAITRTEYGFLLPLTSVFLLGHGLLRWRRWGAVVRRVALMWALSLPLLLIQPAASGWKDHRSLIPPRQSGFLDIWRTWYDLELTQLRFHQLDGVAQQASRMTSGELVALRFQLQALKRSPAGQDPVEDRLLDRLEEDLRAIQRFVAVQGLSLFDAYRQRGMERMVNDAAGYVTRVLKRLALFVTAAELDWPRGHPAHFVYTVVLRPVSTLAYLGLVVLLVTNRACSRATAGILGVWMVFPSLVHSLFVFEQRFAYPAIPILCVMLVLAVQAVTKTRHRHDLKSNVSIPRTLEFART